LGPKKRLNTSPLTPPSKQRTPRQSRGSTTSYAAVLGIWSMTSGTSPLLPGRTRASHGFGGVGGR
jgi:hypothetical protein